MAAIEPGSEPVAPEGSAAASDNIPEFKNVREAQAWQREHGGLPNPGDLPEPTVAVVEPAPVVDDLEDVFPPAAAPAAAVPSGTPAPPAPPEGTDPFEEFGGRQQVADAVTVANALKTESGVRAIVAQGLQALKYTPAQIQAFLSSPEGQATVAAGVVPEPAAPADPWADIADDDVVDGATVKQMLKGLGEQIAQQVAAAQAEATMPLAQQIQEDRQRVATNTVDSTLSELIPDLPKDGTAPTDVQREKIQDIQAFASRYIDPNNWDPAHIRNAILRGHADMAARDERRLQDYVASKRAAKAAVPTNIGGTTPGGEVPREPQSAKEAAQMRKALGIV